MLDYSAKQIIDISHNQLRRVIGSGALSARSRLIRGRDLERFERGWKVYADTNTKGERIIRYNIHFNGGRLVIDCVRLWDGERASRTFYLVRGDYHDLTLALML